MLPIYDIYDTDRYPVLASTMWDAFEATVLRDEHALSVVDGERRFTRAEVRDAAYVFAEQMRDSGCEVRHRVVMIGGNSFESVAAAAAASYLGVTIVPIPSSSGAREITYVLDKISPTAVVCTEADRLSDVRTFSKKAPVIDATDAPQHTSSFRTDRRLGVDDVAMVGFTSGTTGNPKGVMLSSAAINYCVVRWAEVIGIVEGDSILNLIPLSYLTGYAYGTHLALTHGLTLVCQRKWSPRAALDLMIAERCAWCMTVPSHVLMFLEEAEQVPADLGFMRALTVGGSAIAEDLVSRTRKLLNVDLLRCYGMSECLGVAISRPSDPAEYRQRYDGFPILNSDVEAFDEDGRILPRGQVGIAGVRGPSMFLGYFDEPLLTKDSFSAAGFLMTGDLIERTESGHVRVLGRVKDFIIRGGSNIDPVEIENALRAHEAVRDAAVVGYPDARLGEKVCAFVVFGDSLTTLSFEELSSHLLEFGLSKHKVPERYIKIDTIPISEVGKPHKTRLRALVDDPSVERL